MTLAPVSALLPRRVAGLAATCVVTSVALLAGTGSPAGAVSRCEFAHHHLAVSIPAGHTVRLLPYPDGSINYTDLSDSTRSSCGRSTVHNTDRIDVSSPGRSRLNYDQSYRRFAPGATAEAGTDEIELFLHGVTSVWLFGTEGGDAVTLGRGGFNVDGDGDADIMGAGTVRDVDVFLFGGDDVFSARGGNGTGRHWPSRRGLIAQGDEGRDVLLGRAGSDSLDGGLGPDTLAGRGGDDYLTGGDSANYAQPTGNTIYGGAGDDVLEGSFFPDGLYGGSGNDVLHAAHLDTDLVVDGGDGNDSATLDATDPQTGIESAM
jgi:Ca2+-binding RTX toxin-like protein